MNRQITSPPAQGIEPIEGFFPKGVFSFQTNRLGGFSKPPYNEFNLATHVADQPDSVAANRAMLLSHLPSAPLWLNQVHGVDGIELTKDSHHLYGHAAPRADAVYTQAANLVCAVLTADCLPILIAREDGQQVGAAHAGWRGLAAGVLERTVQNMLRAAPDGAEQTWYFWLGPAIGPSAFEVGRDVFDAFTQSAPGAAEGLGTENLKAFEPVPGQPGKWHADLRLLCENRIRGLAASNGPLADSRIAGDSRCTYQASSQYFSYRREGQTGRMASLIYRALI